MNFGLISLFVTVLISISYASQNSSCSVASCVNSGNGDLSTMILCSGCMEKVYANQNAASIFREIQREVHDGDNFAPKRFADLNADVLSLIFDSLKIMDLVHLVQGYPSRKLSAAARDYYWSKYNYYEVDIDERNIYSAAKRKPKSIPVGEKGPLLIRIFGGVMRRVKIVWPSVVLIQYINRYCSDSLVELKMHLYKEEPLPFFKKPFSQLEYLMIDSSTLETNLEVAHIFPKLRRLSLQSYSNGDIYYRTSTFPHLEDINLSTGYTRNLHSVYELLLKNPQIRKIKIYSLCQDSYNIISEYAPNLEHLSLYMFSLKNDVRLDQVKHLKCLNGWTIGTIEKASFPALSTLEISSRLAKELTRSHSEFVSNHRNVTNLIVHKIETKNKVVRLTSELQKLVEITLKCGEHSRDIDGTISELIETNAQLGKMTVSSCNMEGEQVNRFRDRFGDDWNIAVNYDEGNNKIVDLLFEKKN